MDSSVRLPQMQDPNAYANYYAQQKGISVDEAKTQLQEQYGEPQEPQDTSLFLERSKPPIIPNPRYGIKEFERVYDAEKSPNPVAKFFENVMNFFGKGDEDSVGKRQDPDVQAQQYANANNLTLDEAKEALKEKYGEPEEKEEEQE